MSLPGALVMVAASVAATACSPFGGGAFSCDDSAQCGAGGVCEPTTHACSFLDPACASGRSYGPGSGPLAGVCVGDEPPDAPVPDAELDAPPMTDDAAIDGPAPAAFCDPLDPTLRLCLELEGTATDGSSAGNTPTTTSIAFAAGRVGQGVVLTATSRIEVAESGSIDVAHITVETWVNLTELPPSGRVAIADNNGQWGFFISPTGDVRCSPSGSAPVAGAIVAGQWHHVACTYDGTTAIIYVDGVAGVTVTSSGSLGTGGTSGTSIGGDNPPPNDRLIGMMDQFRIFSEARSAAQIADAAGL